MVQIPPPQPKKEATQSGCFLFLLTKMRSVLHDLRGYERAQSADGRITCEQAKRIKYPFCAVRRRRARVCRAERKRSVEATADDTRTVRRECGSLLRNQSLDTTGIKALFLFFRHSCLFLFKPNFLDGICNFTPFSVGGEAFFEHGFERHASLFLFC